MCVSDSLHSLVAMVDPKQTHYFLGFHGLKSACVSLATFPLCISRYSKLSAGRCRLLWSSQPERLGLLCVSLCRLLGGSSSSDFPSPPLSHHLSTYPLSHWRGCLQHGQTIKKKMHCFWGLDKLQ